MSRINIVPLINKKMVNKLFQGSNQHIQFAFVGNHIDRYRKIRTQAQTKQKKLKTLPRFDLIMAVDDLKNFHKINLKDNPKHYTMFSRATMGKVTEITQQRGTKCHFNEIHENFNDYLDFMGNEEKDQLDLNVIDQSEVYFRYGVIQINEMVRDLQHWETLLTSSMMQRPIKRIIDNDYQNLKIWEDIQRQNLRSAMAYAALTTPEGSSEQQLYESIVEIPKYDNKLFQLFDREDENLIVQESFEDFQSLYHPIMKKHFPDSFEISDSGILQINQYDKVQRKYLMSHLNDNVFQQIDKKVLGVRKYKDEESQKKQRTKKSVFEDDKKEEIADGLVEKPLDQQAKQLHSSIDKILLTHRNTSLFLFMLTGPFFVLFTLIKYTIKGGVFYWWYKHVPTKNTKQEKQKENGMQKIVQEPKILEQN